MSYILLDFAKEKNATEIEWVKENVLMGYKIAEPIGNSHEKLYSKWNLTTRKLKEKYVRCLLWVFLEKLNYIKMHIKFYKSLKYVKNKLLFMHSTHTHISVLIFLLYNFLFLFFTLSFIKTLRWFSAHSFIALVKIL